MDRAGAALERPVVDNCDLCRPLVDLDFHIGPRRNMLPLRPVRPLGFIEPCQPTTAVKPPIGKDWIHEIKHDGYPYGQKIGTAEEPAVHRASQAHRGA
jgi:hypothetical protein